MTDKAKWELLEGLILLGKGESEDIAIDSSMSYITRENHLRRLDLLKEVETWMDELDGKQEDEKEERYAEIQRTKERFLSTGARPE